jgi:hypothetical protein
MSAEWFCKIGDKKIGPLSSQQLKTIVARGQLRREHFVRRGSEGPWIPAGRVKGLFPESSAGSAQSHDNKPLQATSMPPTKVAGKPPAPPSAKAVNLPTAERAPAPPVADVPQELLLGEHHKHHVEMNVDRLNIETTPVTVSRRRVKAGLQGLKKDERKKLTFLLLSLIVVGTTFAAIVIVWAIMSDKFSSPKPVSAKTHYEIPQNEIPSGSRSP